MKTPSVGVDDVGRQLHQENVKKLTYLRQHILSWSQTNALLAAHAPGNSLEEKEAFVSHQVSRFCLQDKHPVSIEDGTNRLLQDLGLASIPPKSQTILVKLAELGMEIVQSLRVPESTAALIWAEEQSGWVERNVEICSSAPSIQYPEFVTSSPGYLVGKLHLLPAVHVREKNAPTISPEISAHVTELLAKEIDALQLKLSQEILPDMQARVTEHLTGARWGHSYPRKPKNWISHAVKALLLGVLTLGLMAAGAVIYEVAGLDRVIERVTRSR